LNAEHVIVNMDVDIFSSGWWPIAH